MKGKQKKQMAMIHIGADVKAVQAAEKAVMEILFCPAGTKEKITALETLGRICNVNGTAIQNCQFTNEQ